MTAIKEKFIVDENGNKTEVVLSIKDYEALISELEEFEDARIYDIAHSSKQEFIPFEEAMKEIGL